MAFGNPVVGGEGGELIRAAIKSPNYVVGTTGWIINRDGSAEFNNVTIRIDAAVGGEIIVGPDGMPQVVIGTTAFAGYIEFPSNTSFELTPASIASQSDPLDPVNGLPLRFTSASVTTNRRAFLTLGSESQDLASPQVARIGVLGTGSFDYIEITPGETKIWSDNVNLAGEIYVDDNNTNGNYPLRVSHGKDSGGASTITSISSVNTTITNAETAGVRLETDIAYEVRIQIETRSSSGSSATGTQRFEWKLWDDTIGGGNQLGATIRTSNVTVGSVFGAQTFSFLFRHTGTTGVRTLVLSCSHTVGSDTVQAQVNDKYFMLVHRVGDPTRINNL